MKILLSHTWVFLNLIIFVWTGLARENAVVSGMLTELCVTELEDAASDTEAMRSVPQPVVQESSHPYTDDVTLTGVVKIPSKWLSIMWSSYSFS